ncbi:hypothetical protein FJV46_03880 [Arthrobacter agilis]|uniref:hypothetical protein n=1 Tax=Arthrobacter agilis TaxID=37921 RepID=UPI000B35099B|nr:hypothetical protein [Arthrobacter agilis]OUM41448.1 hypothetical protein B8W74_11160 [Arthrobacter agilis]PPB46221.1 hypothetical protein CI784_07730 [Arthrobacter agilis]TPV26976.1 hypothetical protein FJV46_03880 [Arthrobacter agilis]VDR32887.1 Uncharacterised protein [Arthrobacter agilis]
MDVEGTSTTRIGWETHTEACGRLCQPWRLGAACWRAGDGTGAQQAPWATPLTAALRAFEVPSMLTVPVS